jgi:hypothetical protein
MFDVPHTLFCDSWIIGDRSNKIKVSVSEHPFIESRYFLPRDRMSQFSGQRSFVFGRSHGAVCRHRVSTDSMADAGQYLRSYIAFYDMQWLCLRKGIRCFFSHPLQFTVNVNPPIRRSWYDVNSHYVTWVSGWHQALKHSTSGDYCSGSAPPLIIPCSSPGNWRLYDADKYSYASGKSRFIFLLKDVVSTSCWYLYWPQLWIAVSVRWVPYCCEQ